MPVDIVSFWTPIIQGAGIGLITGAIGVIIGSKLAGKNVDGVPKHPKCEGLKLMESKNEAFEESLSWIKKMISKISDDVLDIRRDQSKALTEVFDRIGTLEKDEKERLQKQPLHKKQSDTDEFSVMKIMVLLVEDSPEISDLIKITLRNRNNIDCIECDSYEKALSYIRSQKFQGYIIDAHLSADFTKNEGASLIWEIAKNCDLTKIPAVLITGDENIGNITLPAGAVVMRKPIDCDSLAHFFKIKLMGK